MNRSTHVLRLRRLAIAFKRKADYWAGVDEAANPWWLRNVRLYQNRMVEADATRSKALLEYLAERGERNAVPQPHQLLPEYREGYDPRWCA